MSIVYGAELKHTMLTNWKGKLIFSFFGETYAGHLIRFFINRRYIKKYANGETLRILEIGSNNGAFCFWLSRNTKHKVVALDIDRDFIHDCENIKQILNRNNLSFICTDATNGFTDSNTFDMIFSAHVLEHILNDQVALNNALENLKPGGVLILQVPYGHPQKAPSRKAAENGHVRDGYTESDLRRKLEYAGFETICATGSVGRIGRFAYLLERKLAKIRIVANFAILFLPITLILIYLEQAAAFLRTREPAFKQSPLVVAKRPL